LKINQYHI